VSTKVPEVIESLRASCSGNGIVWHGQGGRDKEVERRGGDCWEFIFRRLQWPSISRQKELVRQVDNLSQSMLWNWDVSSAGDSTDMSFALGVDSSAAYEIICDKSYIRRSGVRRLQVMFTR